MKFVPVMVVIVLFITCTKMRTYYECHHFVIYITVHMNTFSNYFIVLIVLDFCKQSRKSSSSCWVHFEWGIILNDFDFSNRIVQQLMV